MQSCWWIGLVWMAFLPAGSVRAHFVWILPADKGDSARVVWSDTPHPDNVDEPITTIEKAAVFLRDAKGGVETLKWKQEKDVYRVASPGAGLRTLAVVWNDYKSSRGKTLHTYLAKTYLSDPTGKGSSVKPGSSWKELGLEIVPRPDRGPGVYQLLYKGRPLADTTVVAELPGSNAAIPPAPRSDKDGLFTFTPAKPGLYGLWARYTVAETNEHNGKRFASRTYRSTLVIEVPPVRDKKGP